MVTARIEKDGFDPRRPWVAFIEYEGVVHKVGPWKRKGSASKFVLEINNFIKEGFKCVR